MSVWNTLSVQAFFDGHLVYAMDQFLTPGANGPGGLRDGYCFGLAATWIELRTRLSDHPYDQANMVLTNPDARALAVQRVFDTEMRKGNAFAAMDAGFRMLRLKRAPGRSQHTEDTIAASGLYNVLEEGNSAATDGGNGLYLIGLRSNDASHAIAISNESDRWWRLFDGNYGHFHVQGNAAFKTFLIDYLGKGGTGYLQTYGKGWLTAGITYG